MRLKIIRLMRVAINQQIIYEGLINRTVDIDKSINKK